MAVVTTNLGVITAYGDAVAAGYTGTKAQWQALMASYATVVPQMATMASDLDSLEGRVDALEQGGGGSGTGGVPTSVKQALLTLLKTTAYTNTGLTDEIATIEAWASATAELVSINASYSGGTVRAGTSLDTLRSDLTVIATYRNNTTEIVTGYALSGTLTEGTQTVTVSYGGKTTTFTVTVTSAPVAIYDWDLTDSLTDSANSVLASTNKGTLTSNGLSFTEPGTYLEFPGVYQRDCTYVIDVKSIEKAITQNYARLFMVDADNNTATGGTGYIITGTNKGGDLFYIYNSGWESNNIIVGVATDADGSYYDNSTIGFYVDSDGYCSVYKDGVLLGTSSGVFSSDYNGKNVYIGSSGNNNEYLYNAVFTGFRVYSGNIYS